MVGLSWATLTLPKDFEGLFGGLDLDLRAPGHVHVMILIFTQNLGLGRSDGS